MQLDLYARAVGLAGVGVGGWRLGVWVGEATGNGGFLPWGLVFTLMGAVFGAAIAPYVTTRPISALATYLTHVPPVTLVLGVAGLTVGLVLAALLAVPFSRLPGLAGVVVPVVLTIILGYLGIAVFIRRQDDLAQYLPEPKKGHRARVPREYQILLDTSAIIDGRIADVSQAGFLHGTLVIPRFVLDELRRIADSSDPLRRNRGRRGLEMLNKLRKETDVPIRVMDVDVRNGYEVDEKLVRLATTMKAPIVTTDYNLNRVAELQGVRVLNVNELANALKPVVLPGEEMTVRVIQEGKETGQGVGFLDDGTMVVVEGGRRYINSYLDVHVTRVLQTAAGRVIFAQPKGVG